MDYSYVAYIDESGDPGCSRVARKSPSKGGQSHFLILGAYIVTINNDKHLVKLRDSIRDEIKPAAKKRDLHFKDLKHGQKTRYCQLLAAHRARMITVIINKEQLDKRQEFAKDPDQLYWYACRLLVERISWLCDDTKPGQPHKKVKLVFSNKGGMSYRQFRNYLANMRGVDTQIRWNCIDENLVESKPHSQWAGLQFADGVTSAIAWGIEPQNLGILEPRYGQELKPIIYRYKNGKLRGYGIKILPDMEIGLSKEQRANLMALCE